MCSSDLGELVNTLIAAERRLHGPLPGHVAAQAQRRQQLHRFEKLAGRRNFAGHNGPADAITTGAIHLRQAGHRHAQSVVHQRRHRHELRTVVENLIIDFLLIRKNMPMREDIDINILGTVCKKL